MKTYYKPGCWNVLCSCCGIEKPISEFYLHSNGKPRKQCKTCRNVKNIQWKEQNPERALELARQTRVRNREVGLKATREWRKKNLAYDAFRARTYRARKLHQIPKWANLDLIKQIYLDCPKGMHVDHIVPLKGVNVSGLHVENNLQYLTPKENLSKRNFYADLL